MGLSPLAGRQPEKYDGDDIEGRAQELVLNLECENQSEWIGHYYMSLLLMSCTHVVFMSR